MKQYIDDCEPGTCDNCDDIREVLARLDKAECNDGCVAVEEYDRVLDQVERLRAKVDANEEIHFEQGWKLKRATEENERLRAIEGAEDFSDVLYRATQAEAKNKAALAIAERLKTRDQPMAGVGVALVKALRGDDRKPWGLSGNVRILPGGDDAE